MTKFGLSGPETFRKNPMARCGHSRSCAKCGTVEEVTAPTLFPLLFSPLAIGPVTIANRIVSSGHDTVMAEGGLVSDQLVAYHRVRAEGGVGLIVAQVAGVHESARYTSHMLMATDDSCVEGYRQLAAAVHPHGTKLFGQLFHPGREVLDLEGGVRRVCLAPSSVPNERGRVIPRAMTLSEIGEVIDGYASAAKRLISAGLDGVEIVASHGYLPSQFLNPLVNLRDDRYGGSTPNRRRFLLEVLTAVRAAVPNTAVGLRISLDERDPAGLAVSEALDVLRLIGDAGLVDYVSVTTGTSATLAGSDHIAPDASFASGYVAPLSRRVRDVVKVPVMLAGRINQPQDAERFLSEGSADACVMTRALIADPMMPRRALAGELEDIRACVGCNQACIGHFQLGVAISCIQHPETGRELLYPNLRASTTARRVLVVGGGPGGLKAAAVLSSLGHHVDLYEKDAHLGGQVALAQLIPGREEFGGVTTNLAHEARRSGVTVHLNHELNAVDVVNERADLVVIATGAIAYVPVIERMGDPVVVDAHDVLIGGVLPVGRVLVVDFASDWVGAGVARLLRARGHQVTLSVNTAAPGEALQQYVRDQQLRDLAKDRVEVLALTRLFGVDDDTAYLEHVLSGERILISPISALVTAGWRRPHSALANELDALEVPYVALGDCLAPRTVEEAVLEALTFARRYVAGKG